MTAPLTQTEVVLSAAMALTVKERARVGIAGRRVRMLDPLDTTGLVSGDGSAGVHILGGSATADPSCSQRTFTLLERSWAAQVANLGGDAA